MLAKLDFPDAELYLQGGHLTRFKDWLYLSSLSHFNEGKAIRGGIPIIFPWFGRNLDDTNAPQHGWARTAVWECESQSHNEVTLALTKDDWFIRLRYGFGDTLRTDVEVQNRGDQDRAFELALHSYFSVSDVTSVEVEGLDGLTYIDKTRDNARFCHSGTLRFAGEVDRIYLDAPSPLRIREDENGFELSGNWKSAVAWNPGAIKAANMSDVGEGEWQQFVCLEVGAVADNTVTLEPQEIWTLNAQISRF